MSREKVHQWLRKHRVPKGEMYQAAFFMASAGYVGIDCLRMALWSWLPISKCKVWFRRLEESGIFTGRKLTSNWDDMAEFLADTMVANGLLFKVGNVYHIADEANNNVTE